MNSRIIAKNKFTKIEINAKTNKNTISKRFLYNNIVNKHPTQFAKFRKEKPKSYSLYTNGGIHKTLINKSNNIQRDFTFNKNIFAFNHTKTISNRTYNNDNYFNNGIILNTLSSTIHNTFRRDSIKQNEHSTLKNTLHLPKPSITHIVKKNNKEKFNAYHPIHNNINYEHPLILPMNIIQSKANNTQDESNEEKILYRNKALYQLNTNDEDDFLKDNYIVNNNSESEDDSIGVLSFEDVKDIISYNKMDKINKEENYLFKKEDYSKFISEGKNKFLKFFGIEDINDKSPSTNASSKTNKHFVSLIR